MPHESIKRPSAAIKPLGAVSSRPLPPLPALRPAPPPPSTREAKGRFRTQRREVPDVTRGTTQPPPPTVPALPSRYLTRSHLNVRPLSRSVPAVPTVPSRPETQPAGRGLVPSLPALRPVPAPVLLSAPTSPSRPRLLPPSPSVSPSLPLLPAAPPPVSGLALPDGGGLHIILSQLARSIDSLGALQGPEPYMETDQGPPEHYEADVSTDPLLSLPVNSSRPSW